MESLKILRTQRNLTQAQVAAEIGVDRTTYVKYENGKSEPNFEILQKLSDFYGKSIDFLINSMKAKGAADRLGEIVPVLGDVAAGIPIEAVENIVDWEEIDYKMASTGEIFALRIKGDSMEPRIREGDIVIVRKQQAVDNGDIAVILVNGDSATVKKVKNCKTGIYLIPNNPAYDTQFYTLDEIEQKPVNIIGRVIELRARF